MITGVADPEKPKTKKLTPGAWQEAKALVWAHRKRLSLGLALMLVNRQHWELLPTLALAAGAATLVESATSFSLSQVLGVAAQRAITDMRKAVEAHVMRLPVRYFDSTKSGILISRIMTDAEGIRNH